MDERVDARVRALDLAPLVLFIGIIIFRDILIPNAAMSAGCFARF